MKRLLNNLVDIMRLSFSKKQRLKRKKRIEELFKKGYLARRGPILGYALPSDEVSTHQVLVAVPKRYLKRAVDRNRIKRRMREAYRKHQVVLTVEKGASYLLLAYVYRGTTDVDGRYQNIEKAIVGLMSLVRKRLGTLSLD